MLVEQKGGMRQATVSSLGTDGDSSALEVQIRLVGGIGISVINSVPEELVFINLEQIEVCDTIVESLERARSAKKPLCSSRNECLFTVWVGNQLIETCCKWDASKP